jgi:Fe-S cluster biogenesis protein NfuA
MELASRRLKFAIYPFSSTDNNGNYMILGFLVSVRINSFIIENALNQMYEIIKKIKKTETKPIISIDNGSMEVSACNRAGFFFVLCRFHLLSCWKKQLINIKQNKIKKLKNNIDLLKKIKNTNNNNEFISQYLEEIHLLDSKKYEINIGKKK